MQKNCQFIEKVLSIMKEYPNFIHWVDDGSSIQIMHLREFETILLGNYFRHGNFPSFVRQLNIYGFCRKERSSAQIVYEHPVFREGNEANFHLIKRTTHKRNIKRSMNRCKTKNIPSILKLNSSLPISKDFCQIITDLCIFQNLYNQTLLSVKNDLNTFFECAKNFRSDKITSKIEQLKEYKEINLKKSLEDGKKIKKQIGEYSEEIQQHSNYDCSLKLEGDGNNFQEEEIQRISGFQNINGSDSDSNKFNQFEE